MANPKRNDRQWSLGRVPLIVVPGITTTPHNTEGDACLDDDEHVSNLNSSSSSGSGSNHGPDPPMMVMSPQESVSTATSASYAASRQRQSPFCDRGLSDLQQGYLGENEHSETHLFSLANAAHHPQEQQQYPQQQLQQQQLQQQQYHPYDNSRDLSVEFTTPKPRRGVRRRDGSTGSMKSLSSTSSRGRRMKHSYHPDEAFHSSFQSNRMHYSSQKSAGYDPHLHVSTPFTDNSSESSRGEGTSHFSSERSRNKRRSRHMVSPLPSPATSSASSLSNATVFKKRLSGLQLMLWTLFVAAVTSSTMLISTNTTITKEALYPDAMELAMAPPVIQPQRNNLMHSESGLRGMLVQSRTHRANHGAKPAPEKEKQQHKKKEKKEKKKEKTKDKKKDKKKKEKPAPKVVPVILGSLPVAVPPSLEAPEQSTFDTFDAGMYSHGKSHGRRVVAFSNANGESLPDPREITIYPADFTDNTQYYPFFDSDDERLSTMEMRSPYSEGECVPMQEWQTTFHPSCNGMHELQLDSMGASSGEEFRLFGTKGFWRNAWRLDLLGEEDVDTVVLKTLRYMHNFEDAHFEHDRVDAVAMERLTSSDHVIDIFGFCGHSVMTEFADGASVGQLADKAKKVPLERLKIARDIAHGLADVHGIDGDENPTFVHLDINPANVVSVGGTLKLNDFNIGIIRRWNTTSEEPCGFPTQYPNPQWRSPEEARSEQHLTEKVDIFSMGHIFFRLICGHQPWNKLEPGGKPEKEEINDKVQRGVLPFIPEDIVNSQEAEVIAIRDVMLQCYSFHPKERPTARQIANTLDKALEALMPSADESVDAE